MKKITYAVILFCIALSSCVAPATVTPTAIAKSSATLSKSPTPSASQAGFATSTSDPITIKTTDSALRKQTQDAAPPFLSTPALPPFKATMNESWRRTQEASPKDIPTEFFVVETPYLQLTWTPSYNFCPRIVNGGLLFSPQCAIMIAPSPLPFSLKNTGMYSVWVKGNEVGKDITVVSGKGGLIVFPPGKYPIEDGEYYPVIENTWIEILDVIGSQLILRTAFSMSFQVMYFDLEKRQFVSTLNTPTFTPTTIVPTK